MERSKATYTVYQESGKFPSKAFTSGKRLWRWRLTNQNGNIVADSGEGYTMTANAVRAVKRNLALHGVAVKGSLWRGHIARSLGIIVRVEE